MSGLLPILSAWIIAQTFYFGNYGPNLGIISQIRPDRVLFVLFVLLLIRATVRGEVVWKPWGLPEHLLLLLTGLSFLSITASGALFDDTEGKNKWLNALFNITVFPYAAYFAGRGYSYNRDFVIGLLKLICGLGIYLAFTGIFEHYQVSALVWPSYIMDETRGTHVGRSRGPFMESVAMGRMLTIAFASWLVLRIEATPPWRKLAFIWIPLTILTIYFTETRGPWIGFGLVLGGFLAFKTPIRRPAVLLLICITLGAIIGLSKFSLGGNNLFLERQSTLTDRVVTWLVSGRMIEAHPILGIGFGRFNVEWDNYFTEFANLEFMGFDGSHNTFLSMAAEMGLVTFMIYLLMLFLMFRRCFRLYKRLSPSATFERSFIAMVILLFNMYVFTGWFSDLRWNTVQNTLTFLLLGIIAAMERSIGEIERDAVTSQGASECDCGTFATSLSR